MHCACLNVLTYLLKLCVVARTSFGRPSNLTTSKRKDTLHSTLLRSFSVTDHSSSRREKSVLSSCYADRPGEGGSGQSMFDEPGFLLGKNFAIALCKLLYFLTVSIRKSHFSLRHRAQVMERLLSHTAGIGMH